MDVITPLKISLCLSPIYARTQFQQYQDKAKCSTMGGLKICARQISRCRLLPDQCQISGHPMTDCQIARCQQNEKNLKKYCLVRERYNGWKEETLWSLPETRVDPD